MPSSDNQTAYQRWELASLGEDTFINKAAPSPTVAKLAQELMVARDEAYQQGLEEGRAAGMAEGLAQGSAQGHAEALAEGREQIAIMGQQLGQLIGTFETELNLARENTAQQLLNLSLDMTKAMLKTALSIKPDLLLPILEQALHSLPCLQLPATLRLNPDDLALVEDALGDELKQNGWRLYADPQIEAGGCHLDTGSNQIDVTLPGRWQQLQQALGQDGDWLA